MPERALPVKLLPYEGSLRVPFPRGAVRSGCHAAAEYWLRVAFTPALATWRAGSRQTRDTAGASLAPHAERPGVRHRCQMPLKHGPGGAPVCASYQGEVPRDIAHCPPPRIGAGRLTSKRAHVGPGNSPGSPCAKRLVTSSEKAALPVHCHALRRLGTAASVSSGKGTPQLKAPHVLAVSASRAAYCRRARSPSFSRLNSFITL